MYIDQPIPAIYATPLSFESIKLHSMSLSIILLIVFSVLVSRPRRYVILKESGLVDRRSGRIDFMLKSTRRPNKQVSISSKATILYQHIIVVISVHVPSMYVNFLIDLPFASGPEIVQRYHSLG